jgi:hypothetical protein
MGTPHFGFTHYIKWLSDFNFNTNLESEVQVETIFLGIHTKSILYFKHLVKQRPIIIQLIIKLN